MRSIRSKRRKRFRRRLYKSKGLGHKIRDFPYFLYGQYHSSLFRTSMRRNHFIPILRRKIASPIRKSLSRKQGSKYISNRVGKRS